MFFSSKIEKTQLSKPFVIYVFAFYPIKIWTLYASQNDRWNLIFVKDINVVGNKMTWNGHKMTISKSCIFFNRTDFITLGYKSIHQNQYWHLLWKWHLNSVRKVRRTINLLGSLYTSRFAIFICNVCNWRQK